MVMLFAKCELFTAFLAWCTVLCFGFGESDLFNITATTRETGAFGVHMVGVCLGAGADIYLLRIIVLRNNRRCYKKQYT